MNDFVSAPRLRTGSSASPSHLVGHDVAGVADCHDVRVLREHFEQHRTVVFAIIVLGKVQLDESFCFQGLQTNSDEFSRGRRIARLFITVVMITNQFKIK